MKKWYRFSQNNSNFNGEYQVPGEHLARKVSVGILSHLFRSLITQALPAAGGSVVPKKEITTTCSELVQTLFGRKLVIMFGTKNTFNWDKVLFGLNNFKS